jgi:hypothetical protein
MAKYFKNSIIVFLLGLMVFAIIPQELFHFFHHHHQEIEHVDLDCHNTHFKIKHNHCNALKEILPPFDITTFVQNKTIVEHHNYYFLSTIKWAKINGHYLFRLKAPPNCSIQFSV